MTNTQLLFPTRGRLPLDPICKTMIARYAYPIASATRGLCGHAEAYITVTGALQRVSLLPLQLLAAMQARSQLPRRPPRRLFLALFPWCLPA
jgi:hypothetical protein